VPFAEQLAFIGNWTDNDAVTAEGRPRSQRPESLGNFGIEYRAMDNGFRFIANYRLSRGSIDLDFSAFPDVAEVPLPDYEVLDLSVAYKFNDTFGCEARRECHRRGLCRGAHLQHRGPRGGSGIRLRF
jgi:hypothetical protein